MLLSEWIVRRARGKYHVKPLVSPMKDGAAHTVEGPSAGVATGKNAAPNISNISLISAYDPLSENQIHKTAADVVWI